MSSDCTCDLRDSLKRLAEKSNTHSDRLADARKILWSFDTASKRSQESDGFPAVISLAEGGSMRRPNIDVLLNFQRSLFAAREYEPGAYYFDQFLPELGVELEEFFRENCGIKWVGPKNVCIGIGSSHILDGLFSTVLESNDLVLTSAPFYHAFADFPLKWGAALEVVPTSIENGFKLQAADLERWFESSAAKAKRAKMLLITNPSTIGTLYSKEELIELSAVIKKYRLIVFVDEVYRDCVYDNNEMHSLGALPGMEEFVVTAHSGSKTRGVADLRIGWACGPEHLVSKIIHFSEHSITLVPLIVQRAALDVLRTPQRYIDLDRQECAARALLIQEMVEQVNQVTRSKFGKDAIKLPIVPKAGHGILLDFSTLQDQNSSLKNDLTLTHYFGSLSRCTSKGKARCGVLFAPCYSNGLNGMFVRAAYAEIGQDQMHATLSSEVFAAFESLVREHSKLSDLSEERIRAAARLVGLEGARSLADQEHQQKLTFAHGRALIAEGFARVAHGLLELDTELRTSDKESSKELHLATQV